MSGELVLCLRSTQQWDADDAPQVPVAGFIQPEVPSGLAVGVADADDAISLVASVAT